VSVSGAEKVDIGGDVVGRDKIFITINYNYSGSDLAQAQELIERYLKWVIADCAPLQLRAIDYGAARPDQKPLGLTSVYVDLNTAFQIPARFKLADYIKLTEQGKTATLNEREELRLASALEVLAYEPYLVFLGKPGSGKSTLGLYLALTLAQAGLGQKDALQRLGAEWTHGPLLPVRVVLRQFAESLPAGLPKGRASHLWIFIADELQKCGLKERTGSLIQDIATKAGALFLLDGLDEAGDEIRRYRVLEAVSEFMRTAGEKSRFLLTARPYAWQSGILLAGIAHATYQLADFEPKQIQQFIARWYQAISAIGWVSESEASDKRLSLKDSVQREDLRPLAENPLLLTLMATLHTNRGRLPDDRVDLYNDVVELLLQRWNESTGTDRGLLDALQTPTLKLADVREVIEQVAFEAHAANIGREGTADIAETELLEAFRPLLGGSRDKATLVVEYIEKRAGLLLGQGVRGRVRQFTFPHRTFQEYLAAGYLIGQADFSDRAEKLATEAPAHWREVLVLAARRARSSVMPGLPAVHAAAGTACTTPAGVGVFGWRCLRSCYPELCDSGLWQLPRFIFWADLALSWLSPSSLPVRPHPAFGHLLPRGEGQIYPAPPRGSGFTPATQT